MSKLERKESDKELIQNRMAQEQRAHALRNMKDPNSHSNRVKSITETSVFLASDEASHITGLVIDANNPPFALVVKTYYEELIETRPDLITP